MDAPSLARMIARVAALALLFLACAPLHLATKAVTGTSPWPRRFLGAVAWLVGARVRVEGAPVGPHSLLIANHVSWLDILAVAGATGAAFVSKDNLGHGFIHWLADQNQTIYVRRGHIKGARNQALEIAQAIEGSKPIALFPEGTVGPGTHLLPFRSTLLEAANYASNDVAIRPVALDYGPIAPDIAWFEEPAKENVLRILGRKGTIPIIVKLLVPLEHDGNRKSIAADARRALEQALGFKSPEPSPIGGRQ
ncbi:MAG: lysophospholipid acyltransferase family protein [Pseudomonadota bacterium]